MSRIAKTICQILGVLFFVTGLGAFIFGEDADWYHNLLHFVTGLIALYFGFAGLPSAAKGFCLAFGVGYLSFGILGIAMGDPAMNRLWEVGSILRLSLGDHIFHIVLGTIILAGGILTKSGGSQLSTESERGV
jgi:uncharacterized protein DUF4383